MGAGRALGKVIGGKKQVWIFQAVWRKGHIIWRFVGIVRKILRKSSKVLRGGPEQDLSVLSSWCMPCALLERSLLE